MEAGWEVCYERDGLLCGSLWASKAPDLIFTERADAFLTGKYSDVGWYVSLHGIKLFGTALLCVCIRAPLVRSKLSGVVNVNMKLQESAEEIL